MSRNTHSGISFRHRDILHTVLLVLLDAASMIFAFALGMHIRGSSHRPFSETMSQQRYALLVLATIPFWIAIFALCGLYRARIHGGRISETGRVLAAVLGGVMALMAVAYQSYGVAIFPSRSVPLIAMVVAIPLVVGGRQLVRAAMKRMFRMGRGQYNVMVVGTGELALMLASLLDHPSSGYRVVSFIDGAQPSATRLLLGRPVFPTAQAALALWPEQRIDQIMQADLDLSRERTRRLIAVANSKNITYRFVPDAYGVYTSAARMDAIGNLPVMEVRLTALKGWGPIGKCIFDLVGAAVLLVLLAPVMLTIAVIMKVTEPGAPVFYSQRRIGMRGKEIKVRKFRSMLWKYSTGPDRPFKTAEEAFVAMGRDDVIPEFRATYKVADDPRVSRLGRTLRATSLDELPQLFNVIGGALSLVGPRPVTPDELERYGAMSGTFMALKPGMTGLWQVSGRSDTSYEQRVRLDVFYVENWSVGLDVSILARTAFTVAARRGAV